MKAADYGQAQANAGEDKRQVQGGELEIENAGEKKEQKAGKEENARPPKGL
ncbi:hypothetical protein QQ054_32895 [Oscillatoria amoena NRMC-F 0135]|nr:hypothetical protein [Oscillatoria amoena NRMC-F 0135]